MQHQSHNFPGCLIVVEGTDGSGKSTQVQLIKNWLEAEGFGVCFTEWNSSKLISKTIKKGKKRGTITPITYSLLHTTDFADRQESVIIPALKAGMIVLADRYFYTALARDVARGCDADWVRNNYKFAIQPDSAFYFRVPADISLQRITATRDPKYYEAGMDLHLSNDLYQSYLIFQSKVIDEYDKMVKEFGLIVIDGTKPIHRQQEIFRNHIRKLIKKKFNLPPHALEKSQSEQIPKLESQQVKQT